MSISAQLAQLSKLYIEGNAGGAVTITDIAPGNPTILTAVAHGLSNGDSGPIAGIVGTIGTNATNGLNGKTLSVTNVTDDTFAVQVDTTGLLYTSDGTITPGLWIKVGEVKGIKPSSSTASQIDVTDLDSTAMEALTGLVDNGTFSADINILETDVGQIAIEAAFRNALSKAYKIQSPAKTRTFDASCTKFPIIGDISVNGVQTGTMEFKISGPITVA